MPVGRAGQCRLACLDADVASSHQPDVFINLMDRVPNPTKTLREVIRPTTVLAADRLSTRLGVELTIVSETFQRTGSFKFRAAYQLASRVPHPTILAASSGNFGQALACAWQMLGKSCVIVMP